MWCTVNRYGIFAKAYLTSNFIDQEKGGGFIMSEKTEITFMQTRLIRLASEEWHLPVEQIIHLFKEADVLGYIEKCYGIFHCEGDEAVLEDITEFLQGKGIEISA